MLRSTSFCLANIRPAQASYQAFFKKNYATAAGKNANEKIANIGKAWQAKKKK